MARRGWYVRVYASARGYDQGADRALLSRRKPAYKAARAKDPERWTGEIRDWTPINEVWLNRPLEASVETQTL